MTDRRLTPANGRVAALHLAGQVDADSYVAGEAMAVTVPVADLCAAPDGARDRQMLMGQAVQCYETRDGWCFVQAADGYVGYLRAAHLGAEATPTHLVGRLATHSYGEADFKSPDLHHLPFGCRVTVTDERRKFFETTVGFIPKSHLRPLDKPFTDPVTVAQQFFGTPYLWGGNSSLGIDCSGLVSTGLRACGINCPGDSDLQRDALGSAVQAPYQRGDLLFWKGHVAMVVDGQTIIHANAHHMATAYEPIETAIRRIAAQGDGPVIAHKRL